MGRRPARRAAAAGARATAARTAARAATPAPTPTRGPIGRLAPGASGHVRLGGDRGQHRAPRVAWVIGAGLNGKAKAVLNGGGVPQGTFTVQIAGKPSQSYVNNAGQIVTTPYGAVAGRARAAACERAGGGRGGARGLPDVDLAVDGVAVDLLELVGLELEVVQAATFCSQLRHARGARAAPRSPAGRAAPRRSASWASVWPRRWQRSRCSARSARQVRLGQHRAR